MFRQPAWLEYKHAKWSVLVNLEMGGWAGEIPAGYRPTLAVDEIKVWQAR